MKKLLLFLILLIPLFSYSQDGYFRRIKVQDSIYPKDNSFRVSANEYYLNGALVTFGSVDTSLFARVAAGTTETFNSKITFQDLSIFNDTVLIQSWFNIQRGSNAWIKTIDNYALFLGANNDTAIKIDSLNSVRIYENFTVAGETNLYSLIVDQNIQATNITAFGGFNGDGSLITNYDPGNMGAGLISLDNLPIDTGKILYEDRSDTITSPYWFSGVMKFITNIVDFAAGITTTTLTSSGTVTHNGSTVMNGDMINNGWKKIGSSKTIYQYTRDTLIWNVCGTAATTVTTPHGLGTTNRILLFTWQIRDDSSGIVVVGGATNVLAAGLSPVSPWIDNTNINHRMPSTAVNLDDNTDTIKYFIRYSDYNR